MQLPEVEMIGSQPAQAIVKKAKRPVAGTLVRLGSQKDLSTAFSESGTVVINGACIGRSGIEIVYTLIQGPLNHLRCLARPAMGAQHAFASQTKNRYFLPGSAELSPGDWRGRNRRG